MSYSPKGKDSMVYIMIGTIAVSIVSGIFSWKWVAPESFVGGIWWLIVWGFLSYIGHIGVGLITWMIEE